MNPRVIIVGAGPVGLLTAIQIKLRDPNVPILMLEKHQEYARKHLLYLHQESFTDSHPNPEFQQMIRAFPERIRTNELEASLLAFAKKLKIDIEYTEVKDCKDLIRQYPDAEVIVGADGSHSKVHEQLFDNDYQIKKTLRYIAEVKYEVKGSTKSLNTFSQFIPALTYANHFVSEYVGTEKDGITPVALRIFIDQATYERMQNASFRNPFKFTDEAKMDPAFLKTIKTWLTARTDMAKEIRIPDSERVTVTNLPVYASKAFAKQIYGKTAFLVGDAAFGVPYYRALNNGILCSSQLAIAIDALLHHSWFTKNTMKSSLATIVSPMQYYTDYAQSLVKHENFVAHVRNAGVSSIDYTAAASRMFPHAKRASLYKAPGLRQFKAHMEEDADTSTRCTIL